MTDLRIWQGMLWQRFADYTKLFALSCCFAAMATVEANAASQPTFDLLCDTQHGQPIHFRFDLQQKKWCMGECHSVWFIDELGDSVIKMTITTKDDSDLWQIFVNRYTSQFWTVHRGHGSKPEDWGQCKVEAFSGFPQKKF